MPWMSIIGAVAGPVISGLMGSKSSGRAADAQVGATNAMIEEGRRQYDQTREDQAPFRETGVAANQRLAALLGLSAGGSGGVGGAAYQDAYDRIYAIVDKQHQERYGMPLAASPDKPGLEEQMRLIEREARRAASAGGAGGAGDPYQMYGNSPLLRRFTMADRDADPVYQSGLQFGLDQGTGAINARAIATGNYDSGATLKALTRYGSDYGSTKAGESYNRFGSEQDRVFNKLSGISGTGQVATGQIQQAGMNATNQITGAMADAGNARAAGIVGGARAWGDAATGAFNNYQNANTLQELMRRRDGGYGSYGNASMNPYGGWTGWGD